MTAALERLLEIEVNATEERRLASRLRLASLSDPWTLTDQAPDLAIFCSALRTPGESHTSGCGMASTPCQWVVAVLATTTYR
ncbi:hypothetical protein ACFWY9_10595 [Amycolatopsis sp. NPDC059027]|uniref:hypothetical protein n=1 Tax=Amycolatopsis sp. NPDC059027 TaxID=3346709 RepID=UPI00366BC4FB